MRIFCPAMVARLSSLLIAAATTGASSRAAGADRSNGPGRAAGLSERRPPNPGGTELLDDLGDPAGADGAATLPDREPQTVLHGDRLDQRDRHLGGVPRHDHLGALGQGHHTGHVSGPEVELRPVVVEERRVPATLVLGQDVDVGLEVGVRRRGARLDDDLAALDVLTLDATQQQTDVLTGL